VKKGDKVQRETLYPTGTELFTNCASPNDVKASMNRQFVSMHNAYEMVSFETKQAKTLNIGSWCAVTLQPFVSLDKRTVQWVVGDKASLESSDGTCTIVDSLDEWKVIQEAIPSFQSTVDELSIEELQKGINNLRTSRQNAKVPARKQGKKSTLSLEEKKMQEALRKLTPEQKERLKNALGGVK